MLYVLQNSLNFIKSEMSWRREERGEGGSRGSQSEPSSQPVETKETCQSQKIDSNSKSALGLKEAFHNKSHQGLTVYSYCAADH